jgi:hypothetical protein
MSVVSSGVLAPAEQVVHRLYPVAGNNHFIGKATPTEHHDEQFCHIGVVFYQKDNFVSHIGLLITAT